MGLRGLFWGKLYLYLTSRRTHSVSITKNNTQYIFTPFLDVTQPAIHSYHWALNGYIEPNTPQKHTVRRIWAYKSNDYEDTVVCTCRRIRQNDSFALKTEAADGTVTLITYTDLTWCEYHKTAVSINISVHFYNGYHEFCSSLQKYENR